MSTKNGSGVFIMTALILWIDLAIFTILVLPNHYRERSFHISSSVSFVGVVKFSFKRSLISLCRCIHKLFIYLLIYLCIY